MLLHDNTLNLITFSSRAVLKLLFFYRRKPKGLPNKPACKHKKKNLRCNDVPMQDIRRFHEVFYSNKDKISQDNFILKYTVQVNPKRRRPSEKAGSQKGLTITYYIKSRSLGLVQVCGKTFLEVLGISKFRVQNICKRHHITGQAPKENRGGDTKSRKYKERRKEVTQFIQSLKCVESHYTRSQSIREYFPSDCSARKLWKLYNHQAEAHNQVKYHFFWDIFMTDFNISFKTPATDACSQCIRFKSEIKNRKDNEKAETMARYTVHKLKAKAFHDRLREQQPNVFKFSFDCQKNLVLPKVSDQSAYYSRQLYQYNMTICEGHSKNVQNTETVKIFTWSEDQRLKGSNEISSIVFHYLCSRDLQGYENIEIFSDGCPGQNKNITMIGMLGKWLLEKSSISIKSLEFIFPMVGHSYIPPDRVFGRIEKELRRMETIINPQEYIDIFSKYGQVKIVGKDVPVYDFKSCVAENVKAPSQLHFQFAPSKRLKLVKDKKSILLKGETTYRSDLGSFKPFLKKGKMFNFEPDQLPVQVPVKPEKLKDVDKLLKQHFGDNWKEQNGLDFYKHVLSRTALQDVATEEVQEPVTELDELSV